MHRVMSVVAIIFWVFFGLVFYTYLGYGILLYLMVKVKELFCKPKTLVLPDELPEVTLMIAAYNEESVVAEKMANCLALDYPEDKLKLVWVTDGSNDRTNELLGEYPRAGVLFDPARRGKTAALNRAIKFVRTPLVVFTDANTMLNREAIREIVLLFTNPKVGCVAGEKRVAAGDAGGAASNEGLYWKYESALKSLDWRFYSAVGAAGELFAVRTELFEEMESDTLLDDFIMSMRIASRGYRIAYGDRAYAVEGGSANMKEEEKRKVRIAAGGLQSIWRLGYLFNIFRYGMLSFQYVSHRVLRWSVTPVALFLLLPLNVALVASGYPPQWLYLVLLAGQVLFYAGGLGGYLLSKREAKGNVLYVPYYFLFMNINVIKGAMYLRKKRGTGVWEKAKRA